MSEPLRDLGKLLVSREVEKILSSYAKGIGIDRNELVREVLGKWAGQIRHVNTLLNKADRCDGIEKDCGGDLSESADKT